MFLLKDGGELLISDGGGGVLFSSLVDIVYY